MPKSDKKDRFETTKMSFSEHLEELRAAVFKSLGVLVVGTLIGLLFGGAVVDYIQTPLREALLEFYRTQAQQQQLSRLEALHAEGRPVPEDLPAAAEQWAELGLVPHDIYVEQEELALALETRPPSEMDSPSETPTVPRSRDDLVRLRTYLPLEQDPRLSTVGLSAHESFMVYLKASLVVGVMLASPFIFYFIWEFVAAGLYGHEKRHVYFFLPTSLGLFLAGAALAFFVVFGYVLDFLFFFNAKLGIMPMQRISDWMSFVLVLPIGFGVSFQLPLVMLFLERIGVFTVETYLSKWRVAVLVISVLSMFLTPADPTSMILMGLPLVVLYFGGIALCHYLPRSSDKQSTDLADEVSGS